MEVIIPHGWSSSLTDTLPRDSDDKDHNSVNRISRQAAVAAVSDPPPELTVTLNSNYR